MIETTELRKQVRVVLSAAPADRLLAEPYVHAALLRFFPERVRTEEMMLALQWNEARGWAEKLWNADDERHEWKLTDAGRVKEGVR